MYCKYFKTYTDINVLDQEFAVALKENKLGEFIAKIRELGHQTAFGQLYEYEIMKKDKKTTKEQLRKKEKEAYKFYLRDTKQAFYSEIMGNVQEKLNDRSNRENFEKELAASFESYPALHAVYQKFIEAEAKDLYSDETVNMRYDFMKEYAAVLKAECKKYKESVHETEINEKFNRIDQNNDHNIPESFIKVMSDVIVSHTTKTLKVLGGKAVTYAKKMNDA